MSYTGTQLSADAYRLCAELRNSIAHSESIKAESVKALLDMTDRLNQRNGALEGPNGASITLRLSEYQANNLAQFLWAVVDHPKDEIGSWNTGDWWGEIAFMLQELADKNKGNRGPGK